MKKIAILFLLISGIIIPTAAQEIFKKLRAELPSQIGSLEMFDPPETFTNGGQINLMANYNGDNYTYLNITFTIYNEPTIKRLMMDLQNAPKSFEDDEMKVESLMLGIRNCQLTLFKDQPRYDVTVIDEKLNLLYSFTGSGMDKKEEIMQVVEKVVMSIDE